MLNNFLKTKFIFVCFLACFFASCFAAPVLNVELDRQFPQEEKDKLQRAIQPGEQIIGTVEAKFDESPQVSIYRDDNGVRKVSAILGNETKIFIAAYTALLKAGKNRFQGNIDIRDIIIVSANYIPYSKPPMVQYIVTGRVISMEKVNINEESTANGDMWW